MRRARRVATGAVLVSSFLVLGGGLGACSTSTSTGSVASSASVSSTSSPGATTGARVQRVRSPYGDALARGDGKVLYVWDQEVGGSVRCTDAACLDKWPPLLAEGGRFAVDPSLSGLDVTTVDRPDGTKQVAIGGRPVYSMKIDEPGEANCQGVEGWWLLSPAGLANHASAPTS